MGAEFIKRGQMRKDSNIIAVGSFLDSTTLKTCLI